jgi:alpha-L-fucosidase
MADNCIPHDPYDGAWESPMTLNTSWGYCEYDNHWAEPTEVITRLSTIAAKGGNLLLNIGPDADGVIPEESIKIMDKVGEWMDKNGESIYGTSTFPPFPYDASWGNMTYNAEEKKLYVHVLRYPVITPKISSIGLKTKIKKAYLLSTGEEVKFSQTYEQAREEERLAITVPVTAPDTTDTVVVLELEDDIRVQKLNEGVYATNN